MDYLEYIDFRHSEELYHYGIKGQKWGVRRFQNEDGTLTAAGKKRYYDQNGELSKHGQKVYKSASEKIVTTSNSITKSYYILSMLMNSAFSGQETPQEKSMMDSLFKRTYNEAVELLGDHKKYETLIKELGKTPVSGLTLNPSLKTTLEDSPYNQEKTRRT